MRAVILAFNHHDNVLSYVDPIAKYTSVDTTVILIVHGNRYATGAFEADLTQIPSGLMTENVKTTIFPPELIDYFDPKLKIWLLKLAPRKMTVLNLFCNIRHLVRLSFKTRKLFDVFHFNGAGLYSLALSYLLKFKPRVLTIHDYIPHSGEGNSMIVRINKLLVHNFSHIIQHYDYLASDLANYFKIPESNVHMVRSGTFDFFKPFTATPPNFSNYLLSFGRISPYKGLKHLVEAFSQFCQDYPEMDLVIAGGGDASDIIGIIEGKPRIHLINARVSIQELAGLIEGCRCVMLTYTDFTHSGVVLHAYTYEKPVIVHNLGGLHEVVLQGKTGVLISDLSKESIINGILALPDNPEAEEAMRANIEELTKHGKLSWRKIATEYEKVYSLVYEN